MSGYIKDEMVTEVMYVDGVDRAVAAKRLEHAFEVHLNRSVAQKVRHNREKEDIQRAQDKILRITLEKGYFDPKAELEGVADFIGWKKGEDFKWRSKVFKKLCMPLEKNGFLEESHDPAFGYLITRKGMNRLGEESGFMSCAQALQSM